MKMRHALLVNQMEKLGLTESHLPPDKVLLLLEKVSELYDDQDKARNRLSNALAVSSLEMERIYQELETKSKVMIVESKMITLGEMAAGVAHEINNPLTVLQGCVEIYKELNDNSKLTVDLAKKMFGNMDITIKRIANIVKGLRTFSRDGQNDPFIDYSLKDLIIETLPLCAERFKIHNIDLQIKIPSESCLIACRPSQISQVILNLLLNSKDAIEKLDKKWISLELKSEGSNYCIEIIDAGGGISQAVQNKMFTPFFTTKPVGKGTGLGLSISKSLMRDHGGDLMINSNHPNTCFRVTIPQKA